MINVPKILSNPWFRFTVALFTMIALLLAIYSIFIKESPQRNLTYYIDPVKAVIYSSNQTTKLNVKIDTTTITDDITAIQIAIWNDGELPIKEDNILSPIVIRTYPKVEIFDVLVKKVSREIIKFNFSDSTETYGTIPISWKIMEENDGVLIQIIYTGDQSVDFKVDGIIEGQAEISEVGFPTIFGDVKSQREQFESSKVFKNVFIFLFFMMGTVGMFGLIMTIRIRKETEEFNKEIEEIHKEFEELGKEIEEFEKEGEELDKGTAQYMSHQRDIASSLIKRGELPSLWIWIFLIILNFLLTIIMLIYGSNIEPPFGF